MNMFKYFLLLLLLTINSLSINGQNNILNDTLIPPLKPYIRIGIDLASIGRSIYEPEVTQYEFFANTEFSRNWFVNLEGGFMNVSSGESAFDYSSTGYFFRTGVDLNLLKRQPRTQHDLVLIGLRYGFSSLNHQSTGFHIPNLYWGDYFGVVEEGKHQLHWMEVAGGLNTEIFRNLFLSWSLRTRIRLSQTRQSEIDPYYIGGFGKGNRRAPAMVHFGISYMINY